MPACAAYCDMKHSVLNSNVIDSSMTVQVAVTVSEPVAYPHIDGRAPSPRVIYSSMTVRDSFTMCAFSADPTWMAEPQIPE